MNESSKKQWKNTFAASSKIVNQHVRWVSRQLKRFLNPESLSTEAERSTLLISQIWFHMRQTFVRQVPNALSLGRSHKISKAGNAPETCFLYYLLNLNDKINTEIQIRQQNKFISREVSKNTKYRTRRQRKNQSSSSDSGENAPWKLKL